MSEESDRELLASIQSEEQFAALDDETKKRLLKQRTSGDARSPEAGAVFGDADQN